MCVYVYVYVYVYVCVAAMRTGTGMDASERVTTGTGTGPNEPMTQNEWTRLSVRGRKNEVSFDVSVKRDVRSD